MEVLVFQHFYPVVLQVLLDDLVDVLVVEDGVQVGLQLEQYLGRLELHPECGDWAVGAVEGLVEVLRGVVPGLDNLREFFGSDDGAVGEAVGCHDLENDLDWI